MSHPGSSFWVPSGALQRHVNRMASGDAGVDWLSHVRAKHLPRRIARALVVGCGNGFIERALSRMEGVATTLAVDADAASVELARRRAARLGRAIAHRVLDPDAEPLPDGPWDAVIFHDVLHHAARPAELLARAHRVLARRGRLVFVEYVGPNRFEYPEERRRVVERYFRLLPPRLRRDPDTGRALPTPNFVDAAALARALPFEAAQSEALLPLARRELAAEAEYSGAGGLLHPLLSGLARNFGREPAEEERLFEVLGAAEAHLAAEGILPDAFRIFVGRRRENEPRMT